MSELLPLVKGDPIRLAAGHAPVDGVVMFASSNHVSLFVEVDGVLLVERGAWIRYVALLWEAEGYVDLTGHRVEVTRLYTH